MSGTMSLEWATLREEASSTMIPRALSDGEVVGKWRVLAFVNKGGNGEVYRVEHVKTGRCAALKMLVNLDPTAHARFDLESEVLQTLAQSASPVAKACFPLFLDHGLHGDRRLPYVITEFLHPFTLPRREKAVADFLLLMCSAISELHKNGYLHRDLKPANILCRRTGEPVIIDFGCAIRLDDVGIESEDRLSITGGQIQGVGTEGSTAPEQFLGRNLSPRSDVYALGSLAIDCFKGSVPHTWDAIIRKATDPKPENRYIDPEAFADAIHQRERTTLWTYVGRSAWIAGLISFSIVIYTNFLAPRESSDPIAGQPIPAAQQDAERQDESRPEENPSHESRPKAAEPAAGQEPESAMTTSDELTRSNTINAISVFLRAEKGNLQSFKRAELYRKFWALKDSANQNDPRIQMMIGRCYEDALHLTNSAREKRRLSDPKSAAEYYRLAAAAGNDEALFRLGRLEEDAENFQQAAQHYKEAAQLGHAQSAYNLSQLFCNHLVKTDKADQQELHWLSRAAASDHPDALLRLAEIEQEKGNPALAEEYYRKIADTPKPNWKACLKLADFLQHQENYESAELYYKKILDSDNLILGTMDDEKSIDNQARLQLGLMYENGHGMSGRTQDARNLEAVRLYQKVYDELDLQAGFLLARLSLKMIDIHSPDRHKGENALTLLKVFIEESKGLNIDGELAQAHYLVGWIYEKSLATANPDPEAPAEFYRKALRLGHPEARQALSRIGRLP